MLGGIFLIVSVLLQEYFRRQSTRERQEIHEDVKRIKQVVDRRKERGRREEDG